MARPTCGLCGRVGGCRESWVEFERAMMRQRYALLACHTCWLTMVYAVSDVAVARQDPMPLPIEGTAASRRAARRARSKRSEPTGSLANTLRAFRPDDGSEG